MIKDFQPPFSPGKSAWRGRKRTREKGGGEGERLQFQFLLHVLMQAVYFTELFLSSGAYVFIAAVGVCHVCCCIEAVPLSDQCSIGISDNQDD